jgi:hypothetical protein
MSNIIYIAKNLQRAIQVCNPTQISVELSLYCNDGIKLSLRATVVANEPIVHAPDYTRGIMEYR